MTALDAPATQSCGCCGKPPQIITHSADGTTWLCIECAGKLEDEHGRAISLVTRIWFADTSIENSPRNSATEYVQQCSACGLLASEFMDSGYLGCDSCYIAFDKELRDMAMIIGQR